jgi:hypothetical protein
MEPAMRARSVRATKHAASVWSVMLCWLRASYASSSWSWRWGQRCGHDLCALLSMLPVYGQSPVQMVCWPLAGCWRSPSSFAGRPGAKGRAGGAFLGLICEVPCCDFDYRLPMGPYGVAVAARCATTALQRTCSPLQVGTPWDTTVIALTTQYQHPAQTLLTARYQHWH